METGTPAPDLLSALDVLTTAQRYVLDALSLNGGVERKIARQHAVESCLEAADRIAGPERDQARRLTPELVQNLRFAHRFHIGGDVRRLLAVHIALHKCAAPYSTMRKKVWLVATFFRASFPVSLQ